MNFLEIMKAFVITETNYFIIINQMKINIVNIVKFQHIPYLIVP